MTTKSDPRAVLAVFAALLFGTLTSVAVAQENRAGRYTMHQSDDGFVRLDTETGAVTLCRKTAENWSCRPISVTGTGSGASAPPSDDEVSRLTRENADLKAEIKRLDELLDLRGNRDRNAASPKEFKLPTEQEVDQALNYFERMLKKFQERLKRFERKPDGPEQPGRQL